MTKQNKAPCTTRPRSFLTGLAATAALGAVLGTAAYADMYHPGTNDPGGIRAQSTITSQTTVGTNTTLCWYGMQGWYSVEQSTNLGVTWTSLGRTAASDHSWCFTVNSGTNSSALFRLNQSNAYVGQGGCAGCHGDKYAGWTGTAHSHALADLEALHLPPAVQNGCIVCHTVGFGQPTGFTSRTNTPNLTDVGCETCHGPAGWHKYSDHDLVRPAVSIDPKICGGCHQESHHPTFEEYSESLHSQVNDDVKYGNNSGVFYPGNFVTPSNTWYGYYVTTNSNGTLKTNQCSGIVNSLNGPGNNQLYDPGQDRQASCGTCHSGATRMAMLSDYESRLAGTTNKLVLPTANDSGMWGPTCAVCHDPHDDYNTAQLRNPTRSTNYFTMPTTTDKRTIYTTNFMGAITTNVAFYSTAFASMYDPTINVCGQCHNTRGARWDGRSYGLITNGTTVTVGLTTNVSLTRGPHHSPQYNVLVGIIQPDYFNTNSAGVATNFVARHGVGVSSAGVYNTNQCATCHVPNYAVNANTNVTGHTFDMDPMNCTICHPSGMPDFEEFQTTTTNSLTRIASLLSQWAIANGTNLFGAANATKYGINGWEYNTIGGLAGATNAGPSAADQLKLPAAILQARFNAYIVLNDGSLGVHNPNYVPALLADAENKVMSQFTLANFTATPNIGYPPLTNRFTSTGTGVTGYSWNFGDGNTSTLANPTNVYANPGTYSVVLTATSASGSQTVIRTNLVTVYNKPVITFAADVRSGTSPLTVNLTNTSANASSVTSWRWTVTLPGVSTNNYTSTTNSLLGQGITLSLTNAGSYNIALRGSTPVGSTTSTSNAFITVTAPITVTGQ
jgi:PKD repeat protein